MTSNDIDTCKNEWCELNGPCMEDEDQCADCYEKEKRVAEYWFKQYQAEQGLDRDEILDAYSDPSDYQKRERMKQWLS